MRHTECFELSCLMFVHTMSFLYANVSGSATWLPIVSRNCHVTHITLTERLCSNGSSVINLVYICKVTQTRFECSVLFSWSYQRGLVFPLSLSLQILPLSPWTVNKTSWSNPRQTRVCYTFRVWVYIIKALLTQIPYTCICYHIGLGLSH